MQADFQGLRLRLLAGAPLAPWHAARMLPAPLLLLSLRAWLPKSVGPLTALASPSSRPPATPAGPIVPAEESPGSAAPPAGLSTTVVALPGIISPSSPPLSNACKAQCAQCAAASPSSLPGAAPVGPAAQASLLPGCAAPPVGLGRFMVLLAALASSSSLPAAACGGWLRAPRQRRRRTPAGCAAPVALLPGCAAPPAGIVDPAPSSGSQDSRRRPSRMRSCRFVPPPPPGGT